MSTRSEGAFADLITSPLGERSKKPRRVGLTMVIDKGFGRSQTRGLLDIAAAYIDYWKLPFGTSALYPEATLRRKIRDIRQRGVRVYPGGTFLEIAIMQNRLEAFLERCRDLGFDCVEVSDGTVPIDSRTRRRAIQSARALEFNVLTEVGRKDPSDRLTGAEIHRLVTEDLDAGAQHIIVEGRESGQGVGIYDESGQIEEAEFLKMVHAAGDTHRLIWEAPQKSQQEELIRRFGQDVNLGNVPPQEIVALEALRRGLRADTLRYVLQGVAAGEEPGYMV